jgi:hypothetical protein
MPDDVFRIVVTVAVALACFASAVQACVAIALYRSFRKMQAKVTPVVERVQPVIDKIGPVVDKVGTVIDKVGPILDSAHNIVEDARPRINKLADEAVGVAKSARTQVDHVGELLQDAGGRAKERLEQIDRSVTATVEHVEHAGDAVKRAVMRPVREVNGLAAGVSAAVSTLVKGSRKSSVDHATQDEEMFI